MKRPFPTTKTTTITRHNLEMAKSALLDPDASAEELTTFLVGVWSSEAKKYVIADRRPYRLIDRARSLMV